MTKKLDIPPEGSIIMVEEEIEGGHVIRYPAKVGKWPPLPLHDPMIV